jgi:tetratricopeptide (TPR) repeat protein
MVRFSDWDQIIAEPKPTFETPFTTAMWKYARAMAFIGKDRIDDASGELDDIKALLVDPALKGQTTFSANSGIGILRIAPEVIAGEIAAKRQDWDRAIAHFERAVRFEDALVYQEPPDWHVPARQNLAVALIGSGRADEAETVLWEDLKRNPEHVWNLTLLAKALRLQDKTVDASLIEARLTKSSRGASTW